MIRWPTVFVTMLLFSYISYAESEEAREAESPTQETVKERTNPDSELRSANRRMAQLHWQQAVAARDVEHNYIKAGHHFLHAGKLWASVGSPQDVVDALHAARGVSSLVQQTFVHDFPIRSAKVSNDGKLLCTSLKEGNAACIWSLQTGKRLLKLEHPDGVVGSVFHPDGKLLATSCYDGVSIWDLGTGKLVNSFNPNDGTRIHGPPDEVLFRSKTRQVVVRNRGRIFLWDPDRGTVIQELEPWTTDMQLNREGDEVLTAGRDGTARIWSLDSGKQLSAFNHPRPAIARRVLYLPTGNILTFALDDPRQGFSSTGRIWSREKDEPIATLADGHGLNSLAVSRDGKHVLSAGTGSLLTYDAFLWSTDDGSKVATYTHEEKITAAHFATTYPSTISQNKEALVVTYTKAGTVKIWSQKDHKLCHVLRHPDGIRGLTISDDSQWLAIWDEEGVASVYAMPDNLIRSPLIELRQVLRHEGAIGGLIFLNGGSRALTWSDDGLARTWNLRADQPTSMLFCFTPGSIGRPPPIHSAGDGYWWTNWPRGLPSLWARQRQPVRTWPKDERFRRAEVRNRRVLTWRDDEVARVWKLDGEKPLRELKHEAKIQNAMYLPGGESVLTAGGPAVKIWNIDDDKPVRNYELPSSVIAVELLPTGRGAVVGCQAGQIVVLSFDRGEPVKTLTSDAPIVGIRLSADGQRVASWDAKRKLSVWRLDGAMARVFDFPIESEFELSPDLSLLLTTITDRRQAWLYSLESGKLLKQFHREGEADRELFQFRLAGPGQIASWGSRPHSSKIRLRIWSTADLSEPKIEYDLPGLPLDFVVQPDGIAMAHFGSSILALSLSEHRVLRRFRQYRFGLNQMLFHPTTSQLYTTNPRGEFWQWDFRREDPKSIQRTLDEFEARSGMTIDGDAKYRIRR